MSATSAILLNVDDNEAARYARSRLLRIAGFEVHEAGTGAAALELVRSISPHIVLLDVNLPDLNGIEVCRRIKAISDGGSVLVLQISATSISAPQATEALNNGADSFMIEPVDPDVLIATVRALLRIHKAERDLAKSNEALRQANLRLKEVNAALVRSNEDLESFAYIASHDLQEPLRTIITHVQWLDNLLDSKTEGRVRELFSYVVSAARRMSALIESVLAYSRVSRSFTSFVSVPLDKALSSATQNLTETLDSMGCEIASEELPVVWGDLVQLAQVFQNLIGNAIKYRSATEAPRVRIEAHQSGEQWVISVRDNGIGIAPRFQEQIFSPFKRLHGSEIPGTGIGLALCRRIVEEHGGRIWVESQEGEGATFFFTLVPATAHVPQ